MNVNAQPSGPPRVCQGRVRSEWIDYNGHMNVAYYVLAFDEATDRFQDVLGLDANYRQTSGSSTFALEMHVNYVREIHQDAPYLITTRMLDADHKRIHLFHEMWHSDEGWLAATNEVLTMHIDLEARRSIAFPQAVQQHINRTLASHSVWPRPEQAGRNIGIRR